MGAVAGHDRPVVVEHVHAGVAEDHHRLHGQRHAGHQARPLARPAVVGHRRLHVHARADAVPDVLLDDAVLVARGPHERLDRVADVGESVAGACSPKTGPEGLLGHARELPDIGGDVADEHRESRISVPTIDDRSAVDGDDIAIGEVAVAGDAVDDLLVDRDADVRGEPVVAEEGRGRSLIADRLRCAVVQLCGGHARRGDLRHPLQGPGDDQAGSPHDLELVRGLDLDAVACAEHGQSRSADRMRSVTSATSPMPSTSRRIPRSRYTATRGAVWSK